MFLSKTSPKPALPSHILPRLLLPPTSSLFVCFLSSLFSFVLLASGSVREVVRLHFQGLGFRNSNLPSPISPNRITGQCQLTSLIVCESVVADISATLMWRAYATAYPRDWTSSSLQAVGASASRTLVSIHRRDERIYPFGCEGFAD